MTDPQRALIAVLLDRSGSMESIKSDTEGGFNAFIAGQRNGPLDVRVTLAQFDTEYDVVYANRPIEEVPPLDLQPRGDDRAVRRLGKLITDVGAELAALPDDERPGRVTVVVLTDGHENSSREWTHEAVSAAIGRQERDYSWDFVFLGANMDAVAVGQQLGFAADEVDDVCAPTRTVSTARGRRRRPTSHAGTPRRRAPAGRGFLRRRARRSAGQPVTAEANTRRIADDRPVVDTTNGPVRGVDDGTIKAWKGIRYAAAPVGDLRWRRARAASRVVGAGRRGQGRAGVPAADRPADPDRSRCAAG